MNNKPDYAGLAVLAVVSVWYLGLWGIKRQQAKESEQRQRETMLRVDRQFKAIMADDRQIEHIIGDIRKQLLPFGQAVNNFTKDGITEIVVGDLGEKIPAPIPGNPKRVIVKGVSTETHNVLRFTFGMEMKRVNVWWPKGQPNMNTVMTNLKKKYNMEFLKAFDTALNTVFSQDFS